MRADRGSVVISPDVHMPQLHGALSSKYPTKEHEQATCYNNRREDPNIPRLHITIHEYDSAVISTHICLAAAPRAPRIHFAPWRSVGGLNRTGVNEVVKVRGVWQSSTRRVSPENRIPRVRSLSGPRVHDALRLCSALSANRDQV